GINMINKVRLILLIIITVTMKGLAVEKLIQSLPKEIGGWKAEDQDEFYNRETLYEYINGGAELYLTYDFQKVFVRRFMKQNAPEIVLDIYDMTTSKDAYGIFSSERQDEEVGIGQDSEYGGGLLRFWKDKYFASVLGIGDEQIVNSAILELGKKVAEVIQSAGQKPEILNYLPQENLVKNRTRFFHTPTILNRQYYLASENILNLSHKTDCLFAPYRNDENVSYLLLITYENSDSAQNAYQSFLKHYLPEAHNTNYAQMENKKWTGVKLNQEYLLIVFEESRKESTENLLSTVKFK
ncbi:MAG: hypothetical protein JSV31_06740, partial [Desulfobacterales bacterium]